MTSHLKPVPDNRDVEKVFYHHDITNCPVCEFPWSQAVTNEGCTVWCNHACGSDVAATGATARTFAEACKQLHDAVEKTLV